MTTPAPVSYCSSVNDTDRAALAAANAAVAEHHGADFTKWREAQRARAELVRQIGQRLRAGRYPNRWNPVIRDLAQATGLSRAQVSRIVNETPAVRRRRDDG